jgi:hypothetical protein
MAANCGKRRSDPGPKTIALAKGLIDGGRELLQIWDRIAHDPGHDRALVDAWGERLGLQDWYRWIQFEP